MALEHETPATLPAVDAVEVVDLNGFRAGRVSEYMLNAGAAPCVQVGGVEAVALAALWRKLPKGEQMRCHCPPFGFRFYSGGHLVAQASVCWECNNIHGQSGDRRLFYEFDAKARISRRLLAEAKRITSGP